MKSYPIIKDSDYVKRLKNGEKVPPYPEVPWGLLAPHEEQALTNHGQTIERLAERGGLSPQEMLFIVKNKRWKTDERWIKEEEAILELNKLIEEYEK